MLNRHNLNSALDVIMGKELRKKMLFTWDQDQCTSLECTHRENENKPLFVKELKKIWGSKDQKLMGKFDESNTLLLDDSPQKAICNPANTAIFPEAYSYRNENDDSLGSGGEIRNYLQDVVSCEHIQRYVEQHPLNDRAIKKMDHFYHLYKEALDSLAKKKGAITEKVEMPESAYENEEMYEKYETRARLRRERKQKKKQLIN